jgi:hypothetical protein
MLSSSFTLSYPVRFGFEVLTVASMKMAVFWIVAPCNLVEVYRRFRGTCHDDGGSKYLKNVCKLLPDYTALQSIRQPSSGLVLSSFFPNLLRGHGLHPRAIIIQPRAACTADIVDKIMTCLNMGDIKSQS